MAKRKMYKWTVEFEVAPVWVADGFDMTDERAQNMLREDLSLSSSSEVTARVIKAPKATDIAREQGFKDVESGAQEIKARRAAERLERD